MAQDTQIVELERRHEALEKEIADAMAHPSVDTLAITELKRRKLQLKEEISKLKDGDTVH